MKTETTTTAPKLDTAAARRLLAAVAAAESIGIALRRTLGDLITYSADVNDPAAADLAGKAANTVNSLTTYLTGWGWDNKRDELSERTAEIETAARDERDRARLASLLIAQETTPNEPARPCKECPADLARQPHHDLCPALAREQEQAGAALDAHAHAYETTDGAPAYA